MASGTSKASFKLYQRREFSRDLQVPGMGYHIFNTFKVIFENYRIFLPLLFVMSVVAVMLVGVADEFLDGQTIIFGSLVFLIIWLTTIFVLRQKMAGHKITLRDALYNAMTPLLSTFVVLFVVAVQCLPIMILTIAYSSAVETHFLDTPFYAMMFLVFAGLMILLSGYLLSSTIMALVAVTAPGMYPLEALRITNDLMRGRRMKFVLRIILAVILVIIMWVIIMYPVSLLGQFEWARQIPVVKVCGIIVAGFLAIYISTYFYTYYRWILDFDTKEENAKKRSRKKNK